MGDPEGQVRRLRKRVRVVIAVPAWTLVLVFLLTLIARAMNSTGWAVDVVATVAAQLASISIVLGIVVLLLRGWVSGGVLVAVGLLHFVWLTGNRADWVGSRASADIVTVLTFNAYAENEHPDLVVQTVLESDADVAVVIEASPTIAEAIGRSPELMAKYPGRVLPKPRLEFGVVVLSRWPVREVNFRKSHSDRWRDWRFEFAFRRSPVIDRPGGSFLVSAFWPDSPKTAARWREGNAEARQMTEILQECLRPLGYPIVVGADLNATPSGYRSELFQRLSGLHRAKPLTATRGTWPSVLPPILRIAIDDVLVSDEIGVASWTTLEGPTGSDHVPVVVGLSIPRAAQRSGASP